jgi:hypothetical protein
MYMKNSEDLLSEGVILMNKLNFIKNDLIK